MNEEQEKWILAITFYLEKLDLKLLKKIHSIVSSVWDLQRKGEI